MNPVYQNRNFFEELGHVAYNIVTGLAELGLSLIPVIVTGFCLVWSVKSGLYFWSTLNDENSSAGDVIKSGINYNIANNALDASENLTIFSLPWCISLFFDGLSRLLCPMDYEADEGKVIPRPW